MEYSSRPFNDSQLKILYWYIRNKTKLKKLLIYIMIFSNIVLYIFLTYIGLVYYLGTEQHKQVMFDLGSQFMDWRQFHTDQSLNVRDVFVVQGNNGFNFAARINNPQPYKVATFDYKFVDGDRQSSTASGFIANQEEKYIMLFNEPSFGSLSNIKLEILNLKWTRLPNAVDFNMRKPSNIIIENKKFTRAVTVKQITTTPELKFDILNLTPYDLRELSLNIVIYDVKRPKFITRLAVSKLLSQEKRNIIVALPGVSLTSTSPEIFIEPDINLFTKYSF